MYFGKLVLHCVAVHVAGRPATSVQQPQSASTTSNFQFRPRLRIPTTPQQTVTGPMSSVPPALGVKVRPQTPQTAAGTRPTRPPTPTGIARPTVIRNASSTSRAPVPGKAVVSRSTKQPFSAGSFVEAPAAVRNVAAASEAPVFRGGFPLPVPRRMMAPSRIAAIMLRRQNSVDRVSMNYTSLSDVT